jgi:hypothetical protein
MSKANEVLERATAGFESLAEEMKQADEQLDPSWEEFLPTLQVLRGFVLQLTRCSGDPGVRIP